ncbi:hypothetical protein HUN58_02250 [Curtobacterium sp. Csp1]|uniref:LysR substrate-binding domain-containing protein n=1 Tax=Curtobacterium sp. Csp1 TaxID=2495429 RepID=UPI00159922C7|nr:LysR substrate-binding domain-containing protein [Curtobacterium sp. Csp1]QKS18880.1 hypothetical protein HUN58_02250 [Curtobacterium sp. Csp1]
MVPLVVEQLPDWLSRGSVDLAISVADLPEMFERTLVKRQRYMVLMSESHPLANEQLTLSSYADAPRAVVAGDSGATLLRAAEERAGVHALPTLAVGHFATLPQLLTGDSPFIAAAPGTIADEWASGWGLHQAPLPFPMDPIELVLYRRQTSQHLGALDWFHQQVAREVTTSRGQFGALRGDAT